MNSWKGARKGSPGTTIRFYSQLPARLACWVDHAGAIVPPQAAKTTPHQLNSLRLGRILVQWLSRARMPCLRCHFRDVFLNLSPHCGELKGSLMDCTFAFPFARSYQGRKS